MGDGSSVPPGWYPDPADGTRLRRWDGQGWTADVVLPQPVAPVAPTFAEPTFAPPAPAAPPTAAAPPPATPTPPAYVPPFQQTPDPEQPQPTQSEPDVEPSEPEVPDWANVPGLTLPPDLSSLSGGLSSESALKQPKFEDPVRPPEPSVLRPPVFEEPPAPKIEQPAVTPVQPVTPVDPGPAVPAQPATPYAPPPSGSQYSAPPPPGVAYTPPPSGVALPASALPKPPQPRLPGESRLIPSRLVEQNAGQQFATAAVAQVRPSIAAAPLAPPVVPRQVAVAASDPSANTLSVWIIAILPLLQFTVVYVVFGVLAQPMIPGIQWGILILPGLFSLLFAAADRRRLIALGHDQAPNAALGILAPVYLIARVVVLGPRSAAPLIVWAVLQAAAVAGAIVLLPTVVAAVVPS
jgi:hypothetical protein